MEILSLKAAGFRHRELAQAAGVSRSTIQRLLNLFGKAGLEGVREFHEQGPTSALAEHTASLGEEFRLRPPSSSAEAAKRIELLTGRLLRICNTTYINSQDYADAEASVPTLGPGCPAQRRRGDVVTGKLKDYTDNE